MSDHSTWGKARFANISIGYGLMATSLQVLLVASTIANNGVLVAPKLFDRGEEALRPRRVLTEEAANLVKSIMLADTQSDGTGRKAFIEGVEVAGKTGTAEKVDPTTGRYSKAKNLSSFVGFAPANSPEIAAIVVIDEPGGIAYGGYVAAPAWQKIVSSALRNNRIDETRGVAQSQRRKAIERDIVRHRS